MNERPFPELAGSMYLHLIKTQLEEERRRKDSIEQRSMWVASTCAAIVAVLVAFADVGTHQMKQGSHTSWALQPALWVLAASALVAVAATFPIAYREPTLKDMRTRLEGDAWVASTQEGASNIASTWLDLLGVARDKNGTKSRLLRCAAGGLAVATLLLALVVGGTLH